MCTAISFETQDHYFGRNLDLEHSFCESVTITPRNYPFSFRDEGCLSNHYAMIGMATVVDGYPLYYDATNEHGLSMAGLNFPGNAAYQPVCKNGLNIGSFEFIPWVLSRYKSVKEARKELDKINLTNSAFNEELQPTSLHWIISDRTETIVAEPLPDGLKIYDNPIGILTNNPPFDFHMHHLCNFINLTHEQPTNRFSKKLELKPYSRGMGAMGLPGDLSSSSRFIKAAFTKLNAVCNTSEESSVSQFFHILTAVEQQRGCVSVGDKFEITLYSSCCNTGKGVYYYTTYDNRQINAVALRNENLNAKELKLFPLVNKQQINRQN